MESTGIFRKIDELGRIVIPKEIRKKLKIRDNDYVEIVISNDVIGLKKYSKIKELSTFAQQLTDIVYSFTNTEMCITDKYNVIAYSGNNKKKYLNTEISKELFESIDRRESIMQNHMKTLKINNNEEIKCSYVMDSIISSSDSIGIIVMYSENKILSNHEMNILKIINSFLNKYLED